MLKFFQIQYFLLIQLLTVKTIICFAISHDINHQEQDHQIVNFEEFLTPFKNCLIILNQFSTEIQIKILTFPIILAKIPQASFEELSFYGFKTSRRPKFTTLTCSVEFILFPPLHPKKLAESVSQLTLLDSFHYPQGQRSGILLTDTYRLRLQKSHAVFRSWETLFRILVTDSNQVKDWARWAAVLDAEKRYQRVSNSHLAVLEVILLNHVIKVQEFYIICAVCSPCHLLYYPVTKRYANLQSLLHETELIYHQVVIHSSWTVKHSLLDDKKVKQLESSIFAPEKIQINDNVPIEFLIFKTSFPNSSTSYVNPRCNNKPTVPKGFEKLKSSVIRSQKPESTNGRYGNGAVGPFVYLDIDWAYLVNMRVEGLEFVTCACRECNSNAILTLERLKVLTSFLALDVETWRLICIFGLTLSIIYALGTMKRSNVWKCFLYVIAGSLVEQSNRYAQNNQSRGKNNFANFLCGSWLLAGIVISTSYKSDYIRKLVVISTPKTFTLFEQLTARNFTLYSTPHDTNRFFELINSRTANLSEKTKAGLFKRFALAKAYLSLIEEPRIIGEATSRERSERHQKLESIGKQAIIPGEYFQIYNGFYSYGELISRREDLNQVAFASWSTEVDIVERQLALLCWNETVSRSKEPFYPVWKGWSVFNWGGRSVLRRMWILRDSGIGEMWWNLKRRRRISGTKGKKENSKNMGQFYNVFVALILGCFTSLVLFGVEFVCGMICNFTSSGLAWKIFIYFPLLMSDIFKLKLN
ncbi:hypothetical protein Fcan01_06405 [Folsomia candida]|uniref:Uncharacterized protein n=1 Tax=Folsomia candida TaxID=158441 RepID=A0A226EHU2_FOLCA|nr:hypothetical protein Fcan01_06405 [Folsomia candida]